MELAKKVGYISTEIVKVSNMRYMILLLLEGFRIQTGLGKLN